MGDEGGEHEVVEVEVERLPRPGEERAEPSDSAGRPARVVREAFGPVVTGVLIDLLDAATLTPLLGLGVGVPLGWLIARQAGLRGKGAVQLALVVGLYCAVPGTMGLPLGTVVGVWVKVRRGMKRE